MDYPSVKRRALDCSILATLLYSSAQTVVGPAAANAGVSFSEVQTTTVTIAVEMTMPNEIDAGSPEQPPLPTTCPTDDSTSKSLVEDFTSAVTKASSDSSIDSNYESSLLPQKISTPSDTEGSTEDSESKSNPTPAPAPAPSDIGPNDTASQISPPVAVSDPGDMHGTIEGPNPEPTPVITADSKPSDTDSEDDEAEKETTTLNCLICHNRVSAPCWYCIDCRQNDFDAFVCSSCETDIECLYPWEYQSRYHKEALASSSGHNVLHLLIRFGNTEGNPPPEALESSEKQQDLDRRLREVEERLIFRMEKLQEQSDAAEQRLARIEALLQALLPSSVSVLKNNHT
ncbi:hypothetical protein FB451DRAFT_1568782 [Mycena latifolia]|nr:hypothetical protein FB451DRAFT_1568782 [Mycena latifolia]